MDDELLDFRTEWMSEIITNKRRTDDQSKNENQIVKKMKVKAKPSSQNVSSKNNTTDLFPAFQIANDYLKNIHDCKYCLSRDCRKCADRDADRDGDSSSSTKKHIKKMTDIQKRRKKELWKRIPDREQSGSSNENLLEVLISDIDEITCIPFFDLELPKELALCIFQYLSVKDLSNCCLVNKKWKHLAEDDLIWFEQCRMLSIKTYVECAAHKTGWKKFVKESMLERRRIQQKWKERFCDVRDLQNEKGGIVCCVSTHDNTLMVAYLDGSVKLWDLSTGNYGHNLKEQYTTDEEVVTSMCSCLSITKNKCAAAFQNGDLMIWKIDSYECGRLVYMHNFNNSPIQYIELSKQKPCICIVQPMKMIVMMARGLLDQWEWENVCEQTYTDAISVIRMIDEPFPAVLVILRGNLQIHPLERASSSVVLDTLVGATFSCLDHKNQYAVAAVNSFGYSLLGGYRIRRYCIHSGRQVSNLIGPLLSITCLNYKDCPDDKVVVACSDFKIRIHDFQSECLLLIIEGVNSDVTTLQMDKWKVLSGHRDGAVCLWDSVNGTLYWRTQQRHPVQLCYFTEHLLTSVHLPIDKYPRNSNWNADDLMQNRKYRGSIRVMDFSKDIFTVGVPDECRADYDNITGYDYNIQLIAPYDDVDEFNLPKI